MTEDSELLRRYAEKKSQDAFAELVRRRIGLVYAVAVRQCGGDAHLAEDVTQKVFADLARKAAELAGRPVLSGWLYRSAQFAASDVVRGERRRRAREEENHIMNDILAGEPGAGGAAADGRAGAPGPDAGGGAERGAKALPWVTSSYFAEGLPYSIVHQISAQLFTALGASLPAIGLTALVAWGAGHA